MWGRAIVTPVRTCSANKKVTIEMSCFRFMKFSTDRLIQLSNFSQKTVLKSLLHRLMIESIKLIFIKKFIFLYKICTVILAVRVNFKCIYLWSICKVIFYFTHVLLKYNFLLVCTSKYFYFNKIFYIFNHTRTVIFFFYSPKWFHYCLDVP